MARLTPTNEPWKDCPRADECCCNDCSLTLKRFSSDSSDPQQKCSFGKTGRMRIGEKWHLKNLGLKPREFASYQTWHNLPEEVKEAKLKRLKETSLTNKFSSVGYMVAPKKKNTSRLWGQNDKIPFQMHEGSSFEEELA